jgi:TolB-like protein/DNA-binding winged helix-turn-helix (wHTH) protein/tetratricopeptide (TPR) repeat protein
MSKPKQGKYFYEFGQFRLDPAARLLFRDGAIVPLPPKVLDTLLVLVEKGGALIEKEELIKAVWPDTFVEENNLTQNISLLRKTLGGGDSDQQPYIATVPKRGYRFVAALREVREEIPIAEEPAPVLSPESLDPAPPNQRTLGRRSVGALLCTLVLLAAMGYWLFGTRSGRTESGQTIRSVAVLPFVNISSDPENEYFSDGLTEELINALAKVKGLRVPARTSAFRFKGKAHDLREVGRQLDVAAVLEGSVRKDGDKLRITAQLVRVANGFHLWSETYDRRLMDVFAIQEDICRDIVNALEIRLADTPGRQPVRRYTDNLEIYTTYWKGRYHLLDKRTWDGTLKAKEYFEQAIRRDPRYAPALTGLADCYSLFGTYNLLPPREAFSKARTLALEALAIDDSLAEAHTSLASIKAFYDWDPAAAEAGFKRAIALNPAYALAHQWFAEYLSTMGRHDEALLEIRRAQEVDPLSPIVNSIAGLTLYFARQYDRAVEQCRRTVEMDPSFSIASFFLGYAYEQKRMYAEAIRAFEKGIALSSTGKAYLGRAYALAGRRAESAKILDELQAASRESYVSPIDFALIYTALGERDQAFLWLERAYQDRSNYLRYLKVDPRYDSLRSDPRFSALLNRLGFQ